MKYVALAITAAAIAAGGFMAGLHDSIASSRPTMGFSISAPLLPGNVPTRATRFEGRERDVRVVYSGPAFR